MTFKNNTDKICSICGLKPKKKSFDMPAIVFNYLDDYPIICEKCVFEKLTGKKVEYIDCIRSNLVK